MSLADLNLELNRLNTFENKWSHAYISKEILAKTGFFFFGPFDEVKCNFCNVVLKNWKPNENEVMKHIRWSPNCPLLRRKITRNVPIPPLRKLEQLLPPSSYDICGIFLESSSDSSVADRKKQRPE